MRAIWRGPAPRQTSGEEHPTMTTAASRREAFRRPAATLIFVGMAAAIVAAYQLHALTSLTAALAVFVFCVSAAFTVLNSFTTELFPTDCRAEAFAWANNLLGRSGYVFGPAIVGAAAGAVGWGTAISLTAICPVVALALILWLLPETKGRKLA
jgi:putative MFS transporter